MSEAGDGRRAVRAKKQWESPRPSGRMLCRHDERSGERPGPAEPTGRTRRIRPPSHPRPVGGHAVNTSDITTFEKITAPIRLSGWGRRG
ncbi:hypothetical protein GCM10025734_42890 [Kitasatospora paranensis]